MPAAQHRAGSRSPARRHAAPSSMHRSLEAAFCGGLKKFRVFPNHFRSNPEEQNSRCCFLRRFERIGPNRVRPATRPNPSICSSFCAEALPPPPFVARVSAKTAIAALSPSTWEPLWQKIARLFRRFDLRPHNGATSRRLAASFAFVAQHNSNKSRANRLLRTPRRAFERLKGLSCAGKGAVLPTPAPSLRASAPRI